MRHSVCIIDDSIPASNYPEFIDDTKLLGQSVLTYLLQNTDWSDDNVKSLVSKISDDTANWYLTAFKNPSFFFNHVRDNILTPEIIIFDWDYDGRSEDSEEHLLKLLKETYSIIYVYTNTDMEGDVSRVIESDKFSDYRHRLGVIQKENPNSFNNLLSAANDKYRRNFSYRFGKELKINATKAIDEILIEISKLSLEDFFECFGSKHGNTYTMPTIELVSIITEKFKHQLLKQKFSKEEEKIVSGDIQNDEGLVRRVWSYRLYHYPDDDVVRKGDIISTSRSNDETLYLVISSDCHMNQFWKKNFGFVSVIPLHKLQPASASIRERLNATNAQSIRNFRLSSLTNPSQVEGITILPGVKDSGGNYFDYFLNPKEIKSVKISLPKKLTGSKDINQEKYRLPLRYRYWRGYNGKNRARISEPFLSPLIQFVMENITGYGCPDFPSNLQTQIKDSLIKANSEDATNQ